MWFKYGLKAQKLIAQGNGHKQHDLKGRSSYPVHKPLAKLVSIRFHIRYFLDLPLSMCSYVKSFFMKKVSKYHFFAERKCK